MSQPIQPPVMMCLSPQRRGKLESNQQITIHKKESFATEVGNLITSLVRVFDELVKSCGCIKEKEDAKITLSFEEPLSTRGTTQYNK